jgi:F-type H+-transporting ATPase subunit b
MPQIEQIAATYASQFFWLLLTFGILYFGIARALLPKVGRVVENREATIAGDLEAARAAQARAAEAQERRDAQLAAARVQAQELTNAAKNDASRRNAAQLAALDERLAVQTAEGEARVAASRQSALAELDSIAARAAGDIVMRLTGTSPTPEAVVRAVGHAQAVGE